MNPKLIKYLEKIQKTFEGEAVQPEELKQVIDALLDAMKEMKLYLEKEIEEYKGELSQEHKKLLSDMEANMAKTKEMIEKSSNLSASELGKVIKMFSNEIKRIESIIPSMPDLTVYERKLEEIRKSIPVIKETILDTPEQIRDKLEKLKGKDRLDKSAIDGLEDELKRIETGGSGRNVGSFFAKRVFWQQKNLTGAIDGVNKTFTFEGKEPQKYSERIFLNFIEQNPLTDYTIAGKTITYTTAPDASLSGLPHIIRSAY